MRMRNDVSHWQPVDRQRQALARLDGRDDVRGVVSEVPDGDLAWPTSGVARVATVLLRRPGHLCAASNLRACIAFTRRIRGEEVTHRTAPFRPPAIRELGQLLVGRWVVSDAWNAAHGLPFGLTTVSDRVEVYVKPS
jgi:hypothetical protein